MAKPQYLYGSTESEVRRKLRDWKKQTARGLTACKKVFFRDYADNWFSTFKQHSVENSSFDRYESIYLHHIKPVLGDIQIASVHCAICIVFTARWVFTAIRYRCRTTARCFLMHSFIAYLAVFCARRKLISRSRFISFGIHSLRGH